MSINDAIWLGFTLPNLKPCYGKCDLCIWKYNGGCSEWNGWGANLENAKKKSVGENPTLL